MISIEIQEKIKRIFKNDPTMIEKLCNCDAEAIREIGSISQKGINPDDVMVAYESNDANTMKYLYEQAKRLIELQGLYKELCYEYYKKTKSAITEEEQISRTKMNK